MQEFPLNPKALSLGELYGEFDLNTNEWTDGVLSSVMRQTCAGECTKLGHHFPAVVEEEIVTEAVGDLLEYILMNLSQVFLISGR